MAVSSDVTIARNGAGHVKLHPYLITILRWCVSCVWSTASVLLHRLVLAPLPPIAASKQQLKAIPKPRQAGTDHLHPEPKVECVVLHTPETPSLDVIFVHGLYGSLGNTWRQGDWRSKYKLDPQKISLRNHTTKSCECHTKIDETYNINYTFETNLNATEINEQISFKRINDCFDKILPNENDLITENFYNHTVLDINVNNYETQAKFVSELFEVDCNKDCNLNIDTLKCNLNENINKFNCNNANVDKCKCKVNDNCKLNECDCKLNEQINVNKCKIGCGCVCDECYSYCWPKDWIKEDFPGARVISINYTSDPYLWRPLWVKGNKRLQLHERADQMMEQLIQLGVGKKPIIWVGHSKGGLFIKQIYCQAYEAYMKTKSDIDYKLKHNKTVNHFNNLENTFNIDKDNTIIIDNINKTAHDNVENNKLKTRICAKDFNNKKDFNKKTHEKDSNQNFENKFNFLTYTENRNIKICFCIENENTGICDCIENKNTGISACIKNDNIGVCGCTENENTGICACTENLDTGICACIENKNTGICFCIENEINGICECIGNENTRIYTDVENNDIEPNKQAVKDNKFINLRIHSEGTQNDSNENINDCFEVLSSNDEEDIQDLQPRSSLWQQSVGFMFYSVPHRGSPLADIKTPITSRSIELLEISKDCQLVLDLQDRWLVATSTSQPVVRSLVETCRTLMSVLWLRIVSVDSADAGVGSLHGVSVDHREICKPSSRDCLLYKELTTVIESALNKCPCRTNVMES